MNQCDHCEHFMTLHAMHYLSKPDGTIDRVCATCFRNAQHSVTDSIDVEPPCDDVSECNHVWTYVDDWIGDPTIPYGTQDCSHMECEECGETREITREDRAEDPDAARDRLEDERYERNRK